MTRTVRSRSSLRIRCLRRARQALKGMSWAGAAWPAGTGRRGRLLIRVRGPVVALAYLLGLPASFRCRSNPPKMKES